MDTSKEYIKMCDCPEIQGLKPTEFSWIPNVYFGNHILAHDNNPKQVRNCDNPCDMKEYSIWLPTQSQLQDMVAGGDFIEDVTFFRLFMIGYKECYSEWTEDTWEKLWLAYVMEKLHNKKWTGEAWN